MEFLTELWLPIIVSAVAVWIAAAVAWTALPHHKKDFKKLPDESGFIAQLRAMSIPPGSYMIPMCSHSKGGMSEEAKRCMAEGPLGFISLWKPPATMGKNMVLSFCVYLGVSITIGYLAWVTLGTPDGLSIGAAAGHSFGRVFQITGTAGILAYVFAHIPGGIWFGTPARSILMNIIDGVAYGCITGAIFAWLWP